MNSVRSRRLGSMLAVTLMVVAAACTSDDDPNAAPEAMDGSETNSTPPPPAARGTDLPDVVAPPSSPGAAIEPVDLDQLSELPGSLAIRTADGDLIVTAPDGSSRQEIDSSLRTRLTQPTWSNTGDRLAWSSIGLDGSSIEITNVDAVIEGAPTNDEREVTSVVLDSPPFYLSWSPGDSSIGALRPRPGTIEFVFANSITGETRPVSTGQPFYFDWQDDTSAVAAVNGQALLNLDASGTSAPAVVTTADPVGLFQAPAAVADGVVVALNRSGVNSVVLLNVDGTERTLAEASAPISMAADPEGETIAVLVLETAPDSQVISFQNDRPPLLPDGRVSILDLATGEVTNRNESGIVAMQWSPDGSRLALLQAGQTGLQWLVVDDGTVVPLTAFIPSPEFATSYLPFADQYNHSTSWWSPDSDALVFSGLVGEQSGVWVDLIDDEMGAAVIADGDIAVWSPR